MRRASRSASSSTQNSYTIDPLALGYGTGLPVTVGGGYYQITNITVGAAVPGTPATFTITATAIGQQMNDTACATFSIDSRGQQTALTSGAVDNSVTCWQN